MCSSNAAFYGGRLVSALAKEEAVQQLLPLSAGVLQRMVVSWRDQLPNVFKCCWRCLSRFPVPSLLRDADAAYTVPCCPASDLTSK